MAHTPRNVSDQRCREVGERHANKEVIPFGIPGECEPKHTPHQHRNACQHTEAGEVYHATDERAIRGIDRLGTGIHRIGCREFPRKVEEGQQNRHHCTAKHACCQHLTAHRSHLMTIKHTRKKRRGRLTSDVPNAPTETPASDSSPDFP